MRTVSLSLLLLVVSACAIDVAADDESSEYGQSEVLFARRIAPILREKCVACHGDQEDEMEGGLDVRSLATASVGGDSGDPGVIPGDPDSSSIFLAAERGEESFSAMPPKEAERLTDEELEWLREWIETGAKWPTKERQEAIHAWYADAWSVEDGVTVSTSGGLSPDWTNRRYDPAGLWAYQPVERVDIPADVSDGDAIDWLIEEAWPKGLSVAPASPRRELIRRATFDLTGLPPTPAEIASFVEDERPDRVAFQQVVDRLLDSPHYGERMAQHWLDVVRYADSSGFANDYERGNAWRYRDYVVRSFNDDKRYDQFVKEQIAGDEIMPRDPEGIIAVGYLRMGPWELTMMEVERVARQRFLDDVTNSVGETFLGHSLQCARCHDHKFDPVPTRDYYSIQAVFGTTQLAERKAEFLDCENTAGFDENRFLARMANAHVETQEYIKKVLEENADNWFAEKLNAAPDDEKSRIAEQRKRWDEAIAKAKKNSNPNPFNAARNGLIRNGVSQDEFPPQLVGLTPHQHGINRVAGKGLQRLQWEFDRYQPYAHSVYNGHTPTLVRVHAPLRMPKDPSEGELEPSCIRSGGDPFAKGESVKPGTLSVIGHLVSSEIPDEIEGRRTRFAKWVTDPANPLTTRVIVNRVWLWHFGKALAGNPNNFGSTGGRPTHPRLLDYLATVFVEDDWSIKKLHRRIMLSNAYRRASHLESSPETKATSSVAGEAASTKQGDRNENGTGENAADSEGANVDAASLYAVFMPRRLSAEELRDSMLAVSGELNPTLGGIPCRPEINAEVALQPRQVMGTFASAWVPNPKPNQRHRRSLYVLKLRGVLHPMLEVFNSPPPDFSCERREVSTVTPQVFSLFNSQDSYSRALALADRVWRESAVGDDDDRDASAIRRCFELVLCREPSAVELKEFLAHWRKVESTLPGEARPSPVVPLKVTREAVEENTGERFTFEEPLFANEEFEPDLQPADVDRHVRALGDLCLVILNSNEFVYVY